MKTIALGNALSPTTTREDDGTTFVPTDAFLIDPSGAATTETIEMEPIIVSDRLTGDIVRIPEGDIPDEKPASEKIRA
ncbi:MAG: hypothetical protein IJM30_00515 [Thermoguttaceae bacterium]|nr:hypothetical protein [Thermoguttaceae bacterium]